MVVDSSTPFFVVIVKFVFWLHSLLGEDWVQILEVGTVELNQLTEQLGFHLMTELFKGVSIDEEPFERRVSVQVKEKVYLLKGIQVFGDTPNGLAEYEEVYCFWGSKCL